MTTLAIMKARIADELGQRTDLTSQIAYAISDAIAAYQAERFYFNETRSITFTTVADQEFYDADVAASLANIWAVRFVTLTVGDHSYSLGYMDPADMEVSSASGTNTGQPGWYTWESNQIRLYPTPSEAWTVRVGCSASVAAPATDGEAANPWMTEAERLIRSRAKLEMAIHVVQDQALAAAMGEAVAEAFRQLKDKTTKRLAAPGGRVKAMEF